ncbi:hypothetical protein AAJCM20276_08830 [Acetobacter aceti]|uniref:Uncharacterized protein n=1 Tax=Acetobacter aceti TaxID=435 RepID=A0A6S6PG41_ACEAC|nr:hypothetical protein AAJCM20276_08830 [Acetobacter aceti]
MDWSGMVFPKHSAGDITGQPAEAPAGHRIGFASPYARRADRASRIVIKSYPSLMTQNRAFAPYLM